ncbi:MAG: 16S rRNA (guanine(966)-N(2))-methyltransferase RsmD [Flavobacterium sp.]
MRIISGTHKGRRIQTPKGLPVRPTTDLCKEALFNILQHHYHLSDIEVLDLFAGTGNISFEFASRGAQQVLSVDAEFKCIQFIQKISKEFEFSIDTIKMDVFNFLQKASGNYDIIFADPPYDLDLIKFEQLANIVFEKKLLSEDGMLIIEHSKHTNLEHVENFSYSRNYGGSVFSFFE